MSETKQVATVAQTGQQITPMDMLNMAVSQGADLDKLEKFIEMVERQQAKDAKKAYDESMSNVQAQMGRIKAESENKQTRSWYADYASLDRVLRPIYTKEGFSLNFSTEPSDTPDSVYVVCRIAHKQGHSEKVGILMPADGKGAKGGDVMTKTHAVGSAMQYGMRYLLKMIFNVAIGKDDDGNSAGNVSERITQEQSMTLHAKLVENELDLDTFNNMLRDVFKVEMLSAVLAKDYEAVDRRINAAIKKKKVAQ